MKSVPAIAFDYRPSRWLLLALIAVAVLAFIALALCGLAVWLKLALAVPMLVYAAHAVRTFLDRPFAGVAWQPAGHWRLRDASGREQTGELVRGVVLGTWIVLALRLGAKRTCSFVLLPDNCDAETRRKLRVRLARADSVEAAN